MPPFTVPETRRTLATIRQMWSNNSPDAPFTPATLSVSQTRSLTAAEFSMLFLMGNHRRTNNDKVG